MISKGYQVAEMVAYVAVLVREQESFILVTTLLDLVTSRLYVMPTFASYTKQLFLWKIKK